MVDIVDKKITDIRENQAFMLYFAMDLSGLHPYINLLLDRGISSKTQIDPFIHAGVFKLNLEYLDNKFGVNNALSNCMVYHDSVLVVEVRWLDDGAEFFVHRKKPCLLTVVAAVLTTINEIEEQN